jgi:hypothetical protein
MEELSPDFRFGIKPLEDKILGIIGELEKKEFDRDIFRERILSEGFKIRKLKTGAGKETSLLSVDSSLVKKELRHYALWGLHSVVLYSRFDGREHPDPLAHGSVWYKDLMYNSCPDIGVFSPYRQIENRANSIRVFNEYSLLLDSWRELDSRSVGVDYLLIDGSLQTTLKRLRDEVRVSGFREHEKALSLHEDLMKAGKVVGMVEDSHSVDIARTVGLDVTNMALLDLILAENEYIVEKKEGVNVCHIKLPSKALDYTHLRKSDPLVVRWEFSYDDFKEDLENLAAMWLLEADIWHPQIYPLRVTDYLTRRLKIGGVLDRIIEENELDRRYREMREG